MSAGSRSSTSTLDASETMAIFAEMAEELEDGGYEALLYDLLNFDLDSVNLRVIPKTDALLYQKKRCLDPIAAWWLDRLMAGSTLRGADIVGYSSSVARRCSTTSLPALSASASEGRRRKQSSGEISSASSPASTSAG